MKVSTKGRYALRIMIDVAENCADGPVKITDISARQGVSAKYTEQLTGMLVRRGLLRSVRGFQGGYVLVKGPEKYTAGEILRSAEGDLSPVGCVSAETCPRAAGCKTQRLWAGLYDSVNSYLDGITLQSLISGDF